MKEIKVKSRCPKCPRERVVKPGSTGTRICKVCFLFLRYFLDFSLGGKRVRIFCDDTGLPLDSITRAFKTKEKILGELQVGKFRAEDYRDGVSSFAMNERLRTFEKFKSRLLAPATMPSFKAMVRRASEFFRDKDIRQIEFNDLEVFQIHLEETHKDLRPKTIKNHLIMIRSFLNWCLKRRIIQWVPPMPEIMVDEPETHWLDPEGQLKLLNAIPMSDQPIIKFLMLSGVRIGEARALKVGDASLQKESISISATFSGKIYRHRRKARYDRKGKNYEIAIHPEIGDFIGDRVANDFPNQYLFLNPRTGGAYSIQALRKIWEKAKGMAGINCTLYEASRHSVGTQLALAGRSEIQISNQLGHSSTEITKRYISGSLQLVKGNVAFLGFERLKKKIATGPPLEKLSVQNNQ